MKKSIYYIFVLMPLLLFVEHAFSTQRLPNFNQYTNVKQRKEAFIRFIMPFAKEADADVRSERSAIKLLQEDRKLNRFLTGDQKRWLAFTAKSYGIKQWKLNSKTAWKALLNRVDVIPLSMLIAQAATESGWGTSRFAQQGNNLFGQWCYVEGCGLVPKRRSKGQKHEVKVFRNVENSIAAYVKNLNTNFHYKALRRIRAKLRALHKPITGLDLISGLNRYSQNDQYIKILRSTIIFNDLETYDR